MQTRIFMIYKEVLEKRLARKKDQLSQLERDINNEGVSSSVDKRRYIELKAIVNELENCIDMAESMVKIDDGKG